jgi:ABC-type glycerol-3-phosphate transport system permease component
MVLTMLIALSIVFIFPFYWLFTTALKSQEAISSFPITWFPSHPEWYNFIRAVTLIDFGHYLLDSLIISGTYTILVTLTSALVGFAFARLRGIGKRPLFIIMLSTLMLPQIVTAIPSYVMFARVNLIDTYWPWVIWGLASAPFITFLFRQFFTSIPLELEDAAIVDGCSYMHMFWKIFLPLSKPVIATSVILSFTAVWGDYFTPSLFLSTDNTTLSVALATGYSDPHGFVTTNALAGGALLYLLPLALLFFLAQRYFIQGIVTSGLKG